MDAPEFMDGPTLMSLRIFISTGEPSGDLHAANFVNSFRKLRPDAQFIGFGGPKLEAAGAKLLYPLVELAVMWFGRVLLNLHKFIGLANQAERIFETEKPDALVVIDYPGFHWALAKRAKRHGVPVFYYVPPQIWAWAAWRVEKVRAYFEKVYCSLPFEEAWYRQRGVTTAAYVGHPYFDELAERELDHAFIEEHSVRPGDLVVLLPGSRKQELSKNLPMMLKAAAKLSRARPDVRFAIACLHDQHQLIALEILESSGFSLPIEVHSGRTAELVRLAKTAWAVSGSVGLELLNETVPTVVVYKIRRFDLWVARKFITSKYISLVNLLADEEVFPEYLTDVDVSDKMAAWGLKWLDEGPERQAAIDRLIQLRDRVAVPGASDRAAAMLLDYFESRTRQPLKPHVASARRGEARIDRWESRKG